MKKMHIEKYDSVNDKNSESLILKEALFRAADLWLIKNELLAKIIGVDNSTISRLRNDSKKTLRKDSKEEELVITFLRIFTLLDSILGHHIENEIMWLNSYNRVFDSKPIEFMKTILGITSVYKYLLAMRGKI